MANITNYIETIKTHGFEVETIDENEICVKNTYTYQRNGKTLFCDSHLTIANGLVFEVVWKHEATQEFAKDSYDSIMSFLGY